MNHYALTQFYIPGQSDPVESIACAFIKDGALCLEQVVVKRQGNNYQPGYAITPYGNPKIKDEKELYDFMEEFVFNQSKKIVLDHFGVPRTARIKELNKEEFFIRLAQDNALLIDTIIKNADWYGFKSNMRSFRNDLFGKWHPLNFVNYCTRPYNAHFISPCDRLAADWYGNKPRLLG